MPERILFNCAATMIGSVPYTDPEKAWQKINKYLKDLPAWPQLSMSSNLENMYIQYSEGFPGLKIKDQNISLERGSDFDAALGQLFTDDYENNLQNYSVSKRYAAGLHYLDAGNLNSLPAIKGQVTGPISWGLCVADENDRGIIYDDTLADAVCKFIRLKAAWQEYYLRKRAGQTVIFIDEPYLSSLGSAFVALSSEQVSALIKSVLDGITCPKGIHCCGSTDWSLLLKLPIDIISFDAYNYLDSLLCYETELTTYIERGGAIAWGIVPNDEEILRNETLSSLLDRFNEALASLTKIGLPIKTLIAQSIITPSCGLASLSEDAAEQVLAMLSQITEKVRQQYLR